MKKILIFILFAIYFTVGQAFAMEKSKCLEIGKYWMAQIRKNVANYQQAIWNIESVQKECGISLEELGTNFQELKNIKKKGCVLNTKNCIWTLYRKQASEDENVNFLLLMEQMENCDLHLDQVLTSDGDYRNFQILVRRKKLVEKNAQDYYQAKAWKNRLMIYD